MAHRIITDAEIATAEKTAKQALARLKDLKAQKNNADRRQKKKLDDRRKILAGACALSIVQTDKEFSALFWERFNKFLTRENERAIFPELEKSPS